MADTRSPRLGAIFNNAKTSMFADLRVAMPARVLNYNSALQLVDVKPMIKDGFEEEDGSISSESLGVINNVPVIFPGSGVYRITFPVSAGDTVLLVFADRSIDAWQAVGNEADPVDQRRHHLSDAIAIPGLHPNTAPHLLAPADSMTIGSGILFEPMVKGTTYRTAEDAMLTLIQVAMTAIAAAITSAATIATGGPAAAAASTAAATAITTFKAAASAYLSSTVKTS